MLGVTITGGKEKKGKYKLFVFFDFNARHLLLQTVIFHYNLILYNGKPWIN